MTHHTESRAVPYSADLMYGVVADIERYPDYLPWVTALRILSREENLLIAEMGVGYGPFRERYTSRVTLDPGSRTIHVLEVKGPFRTLEGNWRFTPNNAGCVVDFAITFEFANPLLQAVAAHAFEQIVLKMTDAFIARAAELSG